MVYAFLWFYVQELPKAQPAVVLVLKRLRRQSNGLKSHPTDWEKPGIKPATPGLQDIGLSLTPQRLFFIVCGRVPWLYQYWPGGLCLRWFYVLFKYCGESIPQELILTSPRAGSRLILLHKILFGIRLINRSSVFPTQYEWDPSEA